MTPRKDLSAGARAVWLLLRNEGGYWTAGDVAEALLPSTTPALGARTCGRWLLALRLRKHVTVRAGDHRVVGYGVTSSCVPIEGESLEPSAHTTPQE